ncbi:proline--tRNA ligase [Staphylococcus pseudintermedius]|nr:proline--tRNA ligase [Staphylococcus pseudintermedius]
MLQSLLFSKTLKETPSDAEANSHKLLVKGGYIQQHSSGVYTILPIGLIVIKNIQKIIKSEMNRINGIELMMPLIQSSELWKTSGRWEDFGTELISFQDRTGKGFALSPTHEEVATNLVSRTIKSYKQLPVLLYQIQTKFRDEKRPRFGLLRGKEFLMKDAYSFHDTKVSLDDTYNKMYISYTNILNKLNLNFRVVEADSGAMGGIDTHEFMVLSDIGEDTIAFSNDGKYASNIELTPVKHKKLNGTLDVYIKYINNENTNTLVLHGGERKINILKLEKKLGCKMDENILEDMELFNLNDFKNYQNILIDNELMFYDKWSISSRIFSGSEKLEILNKSNVECIDLVEVKEGDISPHDNRDILSLKKAIEVGHIFKLGTKYSKSLGAFVLNEDGKSIPLIMGCYGIGVSRLMAAIVEQNSYENRIIWPESIAPFQIHIIPTNLKNEKIHGISMDIYNKFKALNFDVLLDDRDERLGHKLKDSDLYGIPYKLIVGKDSTLDNLEIIDFQNNTNFMDYKDIVNIIQEIRKK